MCSHLLDRLWPMKTEHKLNLNMYQTTSSVNLACVQTLVKSFDTISKCCVNHCLYCICILQYSIQFFSSKSLLQLFLCFDLKGILFKKLKERPCWLISIQTKHWQPARIEPQSSYSKESALTI